MTNDYIRREDAKIGLSKTFGRLNADIANCVIDKVEPVDVAPVVHAHWILQKENHEFKEVWMKCSACGYPVSRWTGNTNFCHNCGAKMDREE